MDEELGDKFFESGRSSVDYAEGTIIEVEQKRIGHTEGRREEQAGRKDSGISMSSPPSLSQLYDFLEGQKGLANGNDNVTSIQCSSSPSEMSSYCSVPTMSGRSTPARSLREDINNQ